MKKIIGILSAVALLFSAPPAFSQSAPFNAYSVSTLGGNCTQQGSVMIQSANGASKCLGTGANGQVLQSKGTGADPAWLTTSGTGTVTSVGATVPSYMSVANSPVTAAGTLGFSFNSGAANQIFGTPNGASGVPGFRNIVGADFGSQTANTFLAAPNGSTGSPSYRTITGADLPAPGASSLGGVFSASAPTNQFMTGIGLTGNLTFAQPSAANIIYNPPAAESSRAQDARNNDWVNATDYAGVDPTGTTDSTAGLALAISDSASRNKGLMIPCGTYLVDNLTIVSNAKIITNQSLCAIVKRKNSASTNYAASASSANGFSVSGIVFDANAANNATKPGTGLYLTNDYNFVVSNIRTQNENSTDASNFGVGLMVADCQDAAQGTTSLISGSTFAGVNGDNTKLTGLLIERCSNLTIDGNTSSGHRYAGIALTDPELPVPTTATSTNVSFTRNHAYSNGIGIDIAGFTSGYGIGGAQIWSQANFVNSNIVVSDNILDKNTSYGCLLQASGLVVSGNLIQNNGTSTTYGGCSVNSQRFSISGNSIISNSYYGLDIGGSYYGILSGNTIRQNGKAIGQAIGLNIGATSEVTIGANDIGDNGGSTGGWEVLASALDGSGAGNYFPWTGNDLTINGLKITINNSAMGGIKLANGYQAVALQSMTINNIANSANPFVNYISGSASRIADVQIYGSNGAYTPLVASASTTIIPDNVGPVEISGTATINTLHTTAQDALNGGLLQITPSNNGANYTAGATITCTSTGGSPATVNAAVSANGKIYGGYVTNPGGGASAMSCVASDQTCTATPGSVTVSGGAVTAIAPGVGGSGCTNPPSVMVSGITCTNNPQVHATVSAGAVTGYVVDYGGSGCTGSPSATIANGSGFAATAFLNMQPQDTTVTLRFDSTAIVKNATGNIFLHGGDFNATNDNTLTLRSAFGNWYEVSRS